ncbi:ABC transporter substrate-binding protein [Bradyrhizobium hipponense]|uniref:Thiamine pyrimidine synthase n=1 Tax=Bradyrhizobium hipponense TaxID=2605638 RepID=A0A5S4YLM2_9BRAD|nr:ABC transporter substrate-binding protein [Bradyrhizobium hipponense]
MRRISQVPRSRLRRRVRRESRPLLLSVLVATVVVAAVILALRFEPLAVGKHFEPAAQVSLLLDGSFSARFAGEMVATRQGFFDSNVTLRAEPNDSDFVATVAREHAIGVTSGQNFLLAAWRGVPVTAFAASFLDTSTVIFTLESSGLRRPADLVGKRVGYRKASEGDVIFDAMMAQLGLPRSQITKVPDRDTFDALRAGEVDAIIAAVGQEPRPSEPGDVRLNAIKPEQYALHVPGMVYFARSDLVHDRPSAVAQVLEGIIKGWQFVYSDYARSVPVLVSFDPERLKSDRVKFELQQQRRLILPTGGRIADYDESRWRTLRDILIFAKLGEETVPLAQSVDYQFLRDVYRRSPNLAAPGTWPADR